MADDEELQQPDAGEVDHASDDLDTSPSPVPSAELIASWRAGAKVEKQWVAAAKKLGWRGPILKWYRRPFLPTDPEHHRAQFTIEESLRAFFGPEFEDATKLSTASSSISEDSTRTVVVYPIDQNGELIDRRSRSFMRADQELTAIMIVTLVRVPATDGRNGWGASAKIFLTKNDRLLDAKTHWRSGDPSDWFPSPYQALYRCLTGITDDDRKLRRLGRLQGQPRKVDPWLDSRGHVEDWRTDPWRDSTGGSPTKARSDDGAEADDEEEDDDEAIAADFERQFADEAALDEDPGPPTTHYLEQPTERKPKRTRAAAGGFAVAAAFGAIAYSCGGIDRTRVQDDPAIIDAFVGTTRSGDPALEHASIDPPQTADAPSQFDDAPIIGPLPEGVTIGVDETGQAIFSSSAAPAVAMPGMDIEAFVAEIVDGDSADAAQGFVGTSFPCGGVGVNYSIHCPVGAGQMPVGDWLVVAVDLDAIAPERGVAYEYGLAVDPDGDESNNYNFFPPFDWDFFRNTEQWWRLSFDAEGEAFVWADGYVDSTPGVPRYTAAAVIVNEDKLVWVVPTSELTGTTFSIRITAFANAGQANTVPSAATSAGDVNGENPTSPLTRVGAVAHDITISPADWPDIQGTQPRLPFEGDAAVPAWRDALLRDVAARVNAALDSGSADALLDTVHPEVRRAFGDDACRSALAASLGQANTIDVAGDPDVVTNFAPGSLMSNFRIRYETGDVDSPLVIAPSTDGRFYFVFPCQ